MSEADQSRRDVTRRALNDALEEVENLRRAEALLERLFHEIGPYRQSKPSDKTWQEVQNFFGFDDSE